MGKKLPDMFHNNINKQIDNNKKIYSSLIDKDKENRSIKDLSKVDRFAIEQKIFNIFNSSDYIYKADVTIVMEGGEFKKRIVGKNTDNIITIDNE
mgnify:CR=1 FL=1